MQNKATEMTTTALASSPRKRPTQPRSRATVDNILQAAQSIIASKGYAAATTNHIAKVAGVSIGTVYQYFPRKEAIVAALLEHAVIYGFLPVRAQLLASMHQPLAESVPKVLWLILAARKSNPLVFQPWPRTMAPDDADAGRLTPETYLYTTVHAFFQQHRAEIKIDCLDTAMSVCNYMCVGAMERYLCDPAPTLSEEALVQMLSAAALKYLTT